MAEYTKTLKQKYPAGEVSEFVRYKMTQPILEVGGEEPTTTFAGILLLITMLKLQFDLRDDKAFSATVTLPRWDDGLTDIDE